MLSKYFFFSIFYIHSVTHSVVNVPIIITYLLKNRWLIFQKNYLFLGFILRPDISIDSKGFRRLSYNGNRFGHRKRYDNRSTVIWYCTASTYCPLLGRKKRCQGKIRSKFIDGYEMVENIRVYHDHPPLERFWTQIVFSFWIKKHVMWFKFFYLTWIVYIFSLCNPIRKIYEYIFLIDL